MVIISPQVRVVLAVAIAVVSLSFLLWKLKRLGSTKRDPTPDATPSNNHKTKKVKPEASSSDPADWEYDVFLSFRGADVRNNFLSHLYEKLKEKGIHTFKDDKELERGESISPSLERAIERSRIVIVVLSRNYAYSSWCLDELIKIVKCKKTKGQKILPVFYKIDPSDVEEQVEIVGDAFKEHEKKFGFDKIRSWKKALSKVATISGWDSQKSFDGNEAELIKCIVREVSTKLNYTTSAFDDLVGIDSHVLHIEKQLDFESADIRMIGIWGVGGIGKTTITNSIFHKYSGIFESYCFLENVKDKHVKCGDIGLQKELHQILGGFDHTIRTVVDGCDLIRTRCCHKKAFIVLDDVDDLKQLNILVKSLKWFGRGSKIIITTRNKHLLDVKKVHYIYKVGTLNSHKSLILFSKHAFQQYQPENDFWKLSNEFVAYAHGLPLALKVLGTFLYRLEKDEWQSELDKLKKFPNSDIYQVLKISYDGLKDSFVKDVFLDIAFFFIGETKHTVRNILCGYGCSPSSAIRVLKDRALVMVDHDDKLSVHDLILEMAHEIVKEESENLYEQSRFSNLEDVSSLLMSEEIEEWKTPRVKGVSLLDMSKMDKSIHLRPNAFKKLNRLKILKFCMPSDFDRQAIKFSGDGLDYLPHELWYLRWDCFPFNFWPSNFSGKDLVELRLRGSKLECLWNEEMELGKLKVIDLSFSGRLKIFPNLSKAPNIQEIHLDHCENIVEFSSTIQHLAELKYFTLSCNKLEKFLDLPPNILHLQLCGTAMSKYPLEIECADVRMIGIWGMGGVGKTTVALSIFNEYSSKFEYSCFLPNVDETAKRVGGVGLQRQLLYQLFGGFEEHELFDAYHGDFLINNMFRHKKVFIVLDDVSSKSQLDVLGHSLQWFGSGSRILITTRDRHLLTVAEAYCIYEVQNLDRDESFELFSRFAFRRGQPKAEFLELSNDLITYARGLPLALEVLGRFLLGRRMREWQAQFDKLKRIPHPKIHQVIQISFDDLKFFEKVVFLDIAFFFIEEEKSRVEEILDVCNFYPKMGIQVLWEKALLTIDDREKLCMHNIIRATALEVIREESLNNPSERSRLSYLKDVASVLMSREKSSRVEGISLSDMSEIDETIYLEPDAFKKLHRLRILDFRMPGDRDEQVFQPCSDRLDYLSPELVYFRWDSFPFKYWPLTFAAKNLVEIRLPGSKLEYLWNEKEVRLEKLKLIDLSNSKYLKIFPNLLGAPYLREIYFYGCESLIEFSSGLHQDMLARYACRQDEPKKDFLELSKDFVTHAGGLPLALILWGIKLYGLEINAWQNHLEKAERFLDLTIHHVIKTSFENLNHIKRNMFFLTLLSFSSERKNPE